jgi:hypothetical protein
MQPTFCTDGRSLAVKPILFFRQSEPCRFHSLVSIIGRLAARNFCHQHAVLGVLSIDVGLFHQTCLRFQPRRWLSPACSSFSSAGRDKPSTGSFTPTPLGAADAPAGATLAAHRCSNLLWRSRGILLISQSSAFVVAPVSGSQRARSFKGPLNRRDRLGARSFPDQSASSRVGEHGTD